MQKWTLVLLFLVLLSSSLLSSPLTRREWDHFKQITDQASLTSNALDRAYYLARIKNNVQKLTLIDEQILLHLFFKENDARAISDYRDILLKFDLKHSFLYGIFLNYYFAHLAQLSDEKAEILEQMLFEEIYHDPYRLKLYLQRLKSYLHQRSIQQHELSQRNLAFNFIIIKEPDSYIFKKSLTAESLSHYSHYRAWIDVYLTWVSYLQGSQISLKENELKKLSMLMRVTSKELRVAIWNVVVADAYKTLTWENSLEKLNKLSSIWYILKKSQDYFYSTQGRVLPHDYYQLKSGENFFRQQLSEVLQKIKAEEKILKELSEKGQWSIPRTCHSSLSILGGL